MLNDGPHTLIVENMSGNMTLGPYALVRPGSKTSVKNQYLHVDHTDPSIKYEGNWAVGQDIDPSRHVGMNEGDSILFGFCGEDHLLVGERTS